MSTLKAVNVTKYDAGGSGDNIIGDGYIKTTEKIWMDTYDLSVTALTSTDTINIAAIPPGKKITDIQVHWPVAYFSNTQSTLICGLGGVTSSTTFMEKVGTTSSTAVVSGMFRLNNNLGYLTTGSTVTYVNISVTRAQTTTTGTIQTIVRYT